MRVWFLMVSVVASMLIGCSNPGASMGFSKKVWENFSDEKKALLKEEYKRHTHEGIHRFDHLPEGPFSTVTVDVEGGSAMLWPEQKRMAFEPVHFTLALGKCKDIVLKKGDSATVLCICYKNGTLIFDPSRSDTVYAKGGLVLHQNALWRFGVVHPSVTSKGYTAMRDVSLTIQGSYDG